MIVKVPSKGNRFMTVKDSVVSAAAVRRMLAVILREEDALGRAGRCCVLIERAGMWSPNTPASSLPNSFLPPPQEPAESERTRDRCAVHALLRACAAG